MSQGAIGRWETTCDASPERVRLAGWLDAGVGLVVAMLAWPFPLLRQALPWSVHGPLIAAGILVAGFAWRFVSLLVWGRTPVMYLLDLGLEPGGGRASAKVAAAWSGAWTAALLPSLLGAHGTVHPLTGWPARASGSATRSTA